MQCDVQKKKNILSNSIELDFRMIYFMNFLTNSFKI